MIKPRKCLRCKTETVERYELFEGKEEKKIPICLNCQTLIRWEVLKEKKRQSLIRAREGRWTETVRQRLNNKKSSQ